ncbi:MAG: hypothetical protein LBL18_05090 [Bacteroidales bacterium]|nr:hypothetical protein [Bacteroidales bacterium]
MKFIKKHVQNRLSGLMSASLLLLCVTLFGQQPFDCKQVMPVLNAFEQRAAALRTDNPDLVRLHYLFAKDLDKELKDYLDTLLNHVRQCPDLVYYEVVRRYDEVSFAIRLKLDSLYLLKNQTDTLFIEEAKQLLAIHKWEEALAWIEKALQHNPDNAEAKVLRCEIYLHTPQYTRCVELVHDIYNNALLDYELEKRVSDITAMLYNRLYNTGDSLIKNDQAADALQIFTILEEFCHNMPSNYCNDDYYRGILRSKSGVYESYIIIARVALERKNYESALRFLDYAEQYKNENQEFIKFADQTQNEITINAIQKAIDAHNNSGKASLYTAENEYDSDTIADIPTTAVMAEKPAKVAENLTAEQFTQAMAVEYHRLVIDAAYYFAIGNYDQARTLVIRARELEQCHCFPVDARILVIYNNLSW